MPVHTCTQFISFAHVVHPQRVYSTRCYVEPHCRADRFPRFPQHLFDISMVIWLLQVTGIWFRIQNRLRPFKHLDDTGFRVRLNFWDETGHWVILVTRCHDQIPPNDLGHNITLSCIVHRSQCVRNMNNELSSNLTRTAKWDGREVPSGRTQIL